MKTFLTLLSTLYLLAVSATAHDLSGDPAHPHYDRSVQPSEIHLSPRFIARIAARQVAKQAVGPRDKPVQALSFEAFAPRVNVRWDPSFFYVEGHGLPTHNMMVGITSWQQQVPLPQAYVGDNAWRFPLVPVPAAQPQTIQNHFLRGAIAIAANGIPIFNPQNNRGEMSAQIGELDQWGGHCGRADDYHYHVAPLHLQKILGNALPIAYALDGYAIYGLTEPDGSQPAGLDAFNGHTTPALGYHYHASLKYPYVNGGFHGEVKEIGGQVDPQPKAQPMREAKPPLRGASITGFAAKDDKMFRLKYVVGGETRNVTYQINPDGTVKFDFADGKGQVISETVAPRRGPGPPRDGEPRDERRPPPQPESSTIAPSFIPKRSGNFKLHSSAVADGGPLTPEFNGDGAGSTLPLEWAGAPAGTKSYALIMDHLAPGNEMKCYWTIWDIPASITSLPKNVKGIGKIGPSFKGGIGYEPPHSQGPGVKTYKITVYALSAPPKLSQAPNQVTREVLLAAIKDSIIDSAELKVTYARPDGEDTQDNPRRPREPEDQNHRKPRL